MGKSVTFGSVVFEVKQGQKLPIEKIKEWKDNGVYHEMFSTNPYCVVREYIKDSDTIAREMQLWVEDVQKVAFAANGTVPSADPVKGRSSSPICRPSRRLRECDATLPKVRAATAP